VLAVKFNEEVCHVNDRGEAFFFDRDFAGAVSIPPSILVDYQLHFLKVVNHDLFVSEEVYYKFVTLTAQMAKIAKEKKLACAASRING
jgi:hypothetical protein